jgi:hypothetical protein
MDLVSLGSTEGIKNESEVAGKATMDSTNTAEIGLRTKRVSFKTNEVSVCDGK